MPNLNFRMKRNIFSLNRNNQLNQSNNIMNPAVNNTISISREKKSIFFLCLVCKNLTSKKYILYYQIKQQGSGHGG